MVGIFIRRDALRTDSIKGIWIPPAFFVSVASKRLRRYVSPLLATHTPQLVSVASKGVRGLHNYRSGATFLAMSRPADALLGCGFDDGKEAASCRTPNCPHRSAAGGAVYGENCGLEFAMPEIKKAAEKLPQPEKNSHSYPESRVPSEV